MPESTSPVQSFATRCPRCGADNRCALTIGAPIEQCWCSQRPATLRPATLKVPADPAAACYCASCLREMIDAR